MIMAVAALGIPLASATAASDYDGTRTTSVAGGSGAAETPPEQAVLSGPALGDRAPGAYDDDAQLARAFERPSGYRLAPNTAGRAAGLADDGVNVIPSSGRTFVGTPRGTVYDVPQGWAPRVADNGRGVVYQRPGASGNADMIRIMDPTSKYPNGYVRYYTDHGQPLDVFGKPGPASATHIPQDYQGPWPGWPG